MALFIAILSIAGLIVVHEAGHFFAARLFGMRVKRFSVGFFKPLVEWTPRGSETTYSLGLLPLGGYVQVDGISPVDEVEPGDRRSYANQPAYAKLAMIVAGPLANFLTAVLLLAILLRAGIPAPVQEPVVGDVLEGQPASEAGLRPGDRVVTVQGQPVATWAEMADAIRSHPGEATTLGLVRDGATLEVSVEPDSVQGRIGITQATEMQAGVGAVEAVGTAFVMAGQTTAGMAVGIWRMVTGQRTTAGVAGPVGIVQMSVNALETGWRAFFFLLAQLSLSLFLFNFLPIPALDGGRVVFLGVEAVMRRRVDRTIEGYVHAVGLLFVLGLVALVTFRDVLGLL
jgi:regulator of sigma E protease